MKKQKWNAGWKFWTDKDSFALIWDIPASAKDVTLPHDAMMEERALAESPNKGNTGFRNGGVYQYVKLFCVSEKDKGKTFMLHFEGIYMNAFVYVNGELAAKCPYGYTGFYVPLHKYLRYGAENEIRVFVRNSGMPNSRWYSGGGIYRDVWMLCADEAYLVPDGMRITTEELDEEWAVLRVDCKLHNRTCRRELWLETVITDHAGAEVAKERVPVILYEGEEREMSCRMAVKNPEAWSAETPVCYTCESRLYEGEVLLDEGREAFGIRTLAVDAKRGLRVNGKTVKLRGACIHHDNGLLGAATWAVAEYRRVARLKEAGFNAIRMSHHPAAPALLQACDTLGMYVMDEAFDMWTRCKSDNDYGLFFFEWWEKDVEAMVRKDYNHPSVILYSIGNEIPEIGNGQGAKMCHLISAKIKSIDVTRPTLSSINGVFAAGDAVGKIMQDLIASTEKEDASSGNVNDFMTIMDSCMDEIVQHKEVTERLDRACAGTDIAGYNYMTARYIPDGIAYPNRVIVGSETYPPEIARNWGIIRKYPHVIGDFTWTGWDYIGEAGVGIPAYHFGEGGFGAGFPCQLAYCGDIDITGFRRPASYFREIVFGLRRAPYITVQNPYHYGEALRKTPWVISDSLSSWTYPGREGKPVVVEVYAPGDEVELFLNGRSLGRKRAGEMAGFMVCFETVYEPGVLKAVAYENGQCIGDMELQTAKDTSQLQIQVEKNACPIEEDEGILYVSIANVDFNGTVQTDEEVELTVSVADAEVLGFGSANPKTSFHYQTNITKTFHGRALLILQRKERQKEIRLELKTEGGSIGMTDRMVYTI